ncbi:MAG: hypothetical protein ABL998_02225 [Planctomycetota bacterium]
MSRRARLALVALVVGLAAAETGGRFLLAQSWRPAPPFARGSEQAAWLERAERELADGREAPGYSTFDAQLGWCVRRDYEGPEGKIHIDSAGRRTRRAYADPLALGVRRWAAVGESFTFGEEVSDEEAWPARIEAAEPDLELWNFGVGGYGTDQALLRLQRDVRGPLDGVLVGLMSENIGRNVNRYRPLWYPDAQPAAKPRYVLGAGGLELVPEPFATRAAFVAAVRDGSVFAALAEHEHWDDGMPPRLLAWSGCARFLFAQLAYRARAPERLWRDVEGEPFQTTLALLGAFKGIARGLGTERVVVVLFPARADLRAALAGEPRPWATLLERLPGLELAFVDCTDALLPEARTAGVDTLFRESHYSPRGNELVAAVIRAALAP